MTDTSARAFSALPWQGQFVAHLPGDPDATNSPRQVRNVCYSAVMPTPVRQPGLVGWSEALAQTLQIARPTADDALSLALLAGNAVLPGMRPYAARYGGHQFGQWAGQLGDGRAITLGEVPTTRGVREFQLKGAGPTPYSRRADGRAVLRSSVREFLCSEAMHFLGVPTTRALSLVTTGDAVVRDMFYDGHPKAEPGAVVCRVAPSFLRFGNFQILAAHGEIDLLRQLTRRLITDHFPALDPDAADVHGQLLDEVARLTAVMVAHWMRVGFVHGVMNTDNMSVLGLTIDYGPYGWLEPYDPHWTPNTTDAEGRRYCFGNQPAIALWNLTRFAEALLPLITDEARVRASLDLYRLRFEATYEAMLAQKLGLSSIAGDEAMPLVQELFDLLAAAETDFTCFFRCLADWKIEGHDAAPDAATQQFLACVGPAFYAPAPAALQARWGLWAQRYTARLRTEHSQDATRQRSMKAVNPKYVLRNYLAQNAIDAAERGDVSGIAHLLRVLQTPYDDLPGEDALAAKRPEWARHAPGCAALSCSS